MANALSEALRWRLVEESLRVVLDAVERVAEIAFDPRLSRVLMAEGIDLLAEVPALEIASAPFREHRWPQLLAAQTRLCKKNAAIIERQEQLLKNKNRKRRRGANT